MRKTFLTLACLSALAAFALASSWKPPVAGAGPAFRSLGDKKGQEYILAFGRIKVDSDMNYDAPTKTKHALSFEATVNSPVKVDAVAIRKRIQIREALDANGQSLVKPLTRAAASTEPGALTATYNAFHNSIADVELPLTEMTRYPTAIRKLTLESALVVAAKRQERIVPAVVMEEYQELLEGVSVRVGKLEMTKDRMLKVEMYYKRPAAGTDGPFPEAIHALDPNGADLGGGRWTEGDPFGKIMKFTAEFKINSEAVHKSFRVTFVTESTTRTVSFEVKDLFGDKPLPTAADLMGKPKE